MIDIGVLLTALAITIGWLYTSRRNRTMSRQQHTFNALLHASFNKEFNATLIAIRPYLRKEKVVPVPMGLDYEDAAHITFALDHYEFLSAGIRNGDIHERLLKDSDRSIVVLLYEAFEKHIYGQRDRPGKEAVYEHLEWLYGRWAKKPPSPILRIIEWFYGRPLQGSRNKIKIP